MGKAVERKMEKVILAQNFLLFPLEIKASKLTYGKTDIIASKVIYLG